MAVRLQKLTVWELYELYNLEYPRPLPPPPNPDKLKAFYFACLEKTVEQINEENNPKRKLNPDARRAMRP